MKLRNDKILIFGGGSGIGKAIAKRFCDAGAKVLITGRNEEKLKNVAEEINSKNIYCKVFDITNIKEHIALFNEASEILGDLNGFVNAAAEDVKIYQLMMKILYALTMPKKFAEKNILLRKF